MPAESASLDAPFAAVAAFDWGGDIEPLAVIDAAVVAAGSDPGLRADLERRFAAVLAGEASRAARQYVCRQLCLIGTAASVPALAAMLTDPDDSHMARYALERIDAPEAATALRAALAELEGNLRVGMIASLAARGDAASVPILASLVAGDSAVAAAAAEALGRLATPEAAAALAGAATSGETAERVVDARLACAAAAVAAGDKPAARAIYKAVGEAVGGAPATHRGRAVRIACQRGLLATLGG